MTLKSALEDLRQTTLPAVSGLIGKLAYLASLRGTHGDYDHWGMRSVYGEDSARRALRTAHAEVTATVLQTPLFVLLDDLAVSSASCGMAAQAYLQRMRDQFERLLPDDRTGSPLGVHLNSVLAALSSLERNRERTTRSTS